MSDICNSQPHYPELILAFPNYFFKFNFYNTSNNPLDLIYFQRFIRFYEYNIPQNLNIVEKLCGMIILSDTPSQNELENLFISNLFKKQNATDFIVAETIDETADFIYLIATHDLSLSLGLVANNTMLGVFKFFYNEL